MKNVLMVCGRENIDKAIRRSLAHLVKSCQIEIASDGFQAFAQLVGQAFDLIIIDFEIEGIDSLELIESVLAIDPGVPLILMLKQEHKAMWGDARALGADPILRPFKPITFLRLIDTLLHQHLERYRYLSDVMAEALGQLEAHPEVSSALLADSSGQVLMAAGGLDEKTLQKMAYLAAGRFDAGAPALPEAEALLAATPADADHELFTLSIIENMALAVVSPAADSRQHPRRIWHYLDSAAKTIRAALLENAFLDESIVDSQARPTNGTLSPQNGLPLKLSAMSAPPVNTSPAPAEPPASEDEAAINWQIISNNTVLDRLQHILAD